MSPLLDRSAIRVTEDHGYGNSGVRGLGVSIRVSLALTITLREQREGDEENGEAKVERAFHW